MSEPSEFLAVHQRISTSGARAVEVFEAGGALRLAIPQLARDVAGEPPHMNGGDSNVDAPLFVWRDGAFVDDGALALPGGEDIEVFTLDGRQYLAAASLRTGNGPYDLNCESPIYRWEHGAWAPIQSIPTFAAKQWRFFEFGGRRFLALAQGVTIEGPTARHPATSRIYEWDGARFGEFQVLDGKWGYNWTYFAFGGMHLLAYADHVGASVLYRWDGAQFVPQQEFGLHGRAFAFFEADGEAWLAFAPIFGETMLYRWDGAAFVAQQSLGGAGGRELKLVTTASGRYLVRVCFIQGTPHDPQPELQSQLYRWNAGRFEVVAEFPTSGGTDAAFFHAGDALYLAVSNSLSPEVRYRADTVVYRCAL